jgi:lysozyme
MKTSEVGVNMIKHFESCKLESYIDAVGVLTIGYGHTGADVRPKQHITPTEAERILRDDLSRFERSVERSLTRVVNVAQFDACVSLAFNIGAGAFGSSTLLKKINANDMGGASNQFLVWVRGGGKTLPGLVIRRMAERLCFLGRDWQAVV